MLDFAQINKTVQILISGVVRNEETMNCFVSTCSMSRINILKAKTDLRIDKSHLAVEVIDFAVPQEIGKINGPYYDLDTPIRIFHITSKEVA
jgi:hypothetical protein